MTHLVPVPAVVLLFIIALAYRGLIALVQDIPRREQDHGSPPPHWHVRRPPPSPAPPPKRYPEMQVRITGDFVQTVQDLQRQHRQGGRL